MFPVSHIDKCCLNSQLNEPNLQNSLSMNIFHYTDMRFILLDILGCESNALQMSCRTFWEDRRVRLVNNKEDLEKFLSWLIYQNNSKEIKNLGNIVAPILITGINLELPFNFEIRTKCIKKIVQKVPNITSISILKEYDVKKSKKYIFSLPICKIVLDNLFLQLNTLQLYSYLPTREIEKFHFPQNIKKLVLVDCELINARYNKGDAFKQLSSDQKFLLKSEALDLSAIFRQCTQLEELQVSGRCLHSWFFASGGKLPSTLRHLSLTGTMLLTEKLRNVVQQVPELRALDVMWNRGIRDNYGYYEIQNLKYLEVFTISREPSAQLFQTLSKCSLLSIVVEYTLLSDNWLSYAAQPLLIKLPEIIIDPRDEEHVILKQLRVKYSNLKITHIRKKD